MRSPPTLGLILCLAALPAAVGCAATPPRSTLNYGDRARRAYEEAMEIFTNGDMQDADVAFRRVRREFGLSRWAWLAELRLADVQFRQDQFSQAITAYRAWIRYHPTQPEVAYAHFMIARSYYSEIPDEWALVPSSWERDQSSTHDAEEQFAHFIDDYPETEYTAEARDYLRRTRLLLARAEIHVATYYLGRAQYEAAVSRLLGVLETYRGSGLEDEALLRIGEAYLEMRRRPDARTAFETLVREFPRSSYIESARRYLAFIGPVPASTAPPTAVPARTEAPPTSPPVATEKRGAASVVNTRRHA